MASKPEILGGKILERIHIHNFDSGGIFTLTTGSQGSAKTSVLLAFTDYDINFHPNEKIFWSECYEAPLQIFKLDKEKYKFFVQEDVPLTFRDRKQKLKHIKMPITKFHDFDDLYNKAKPGVANVVFFGDRLLWMPFIMYLRSIGEWCNIYIDEFAEICPSYESGDTWKTIGKFSNKILKDIRKCMLNLHTNTQALQNIDDRAVKQTMIQIYLPGSIPSKHSRVTQGAIDNLIRSPTKGNQAYLDARGEFGITTFTDIYKPLPERQIDAICNGGEGKYNLFLSFNKGEN